MRLQAIAIIGAALAFAPAAHAENFTYVLYFDGISARVNAKGVEVIDKALPQIKKCASNGVRVIGHTDLSFSMQASAELAIARAKAVRDVLTARGVADSEIAPMSKSNAEPAVETAEGVKEPRNNRVEIKLVCD